MTEAIAKALEEALPRLEAAGEDTTFARSLLQWWKTKKRWSPKQAMWAEKLCAPDEFVIDFAALNGRFTGKREKLRGFACSRVTEGEVHVVWCFPGERAPRGYKVGGWSIGEDGRVQITAPVEFVRKDRKHKGEWEPYSKTYRTKGEKRRAYKARRAARAVGEIARLIARPEAAQGGEAQPGGGVTS